MTFTDKLDECLRSHYKGKTFSAPDFYALGECHGVSRVLVCGTLNRMLTNDYIVAVDVPGQGRGHPTVYTLADTGFVSYAECLELTKERRLRDPSKKGPRIIQKGPGHIVHRLI